MVRARRDYGNVTSEYFALRSGRGYVEGFSEIVWATGEDAISFLDGQASQDVAAMVPGTTARSFLLEPKGKLAAVLWLLRGEARVGMVVDSGRGAGVIDHLERFKFRVDVELVLDERRTIEVWGPDLDDVGRRVGVAAGAGWVDGAGMTAALLSRRPMSRLVLAGVDDETAERLGLAPSGTIACDALRVEAGEPIMGIDLDEATIPQESGLVSEAVSFTKGCFVGQELVARIDTRGRVNRRLVGITISENVVPPPGSELLKGGAVVGVMSTVAESLAVGAPVALAMVRREAEAGDEVVVRWDSGTVSARVCALPLDDFSEISHSSYTEGRD